MTCVVVSFPRPLPPEADSDSSADSMAPVIVVPPRNTTVLAGSGEVSLECVANARWVPHTTRQVSHSEYLDFVYKHKVSSFI